MKNEKQLRVVLKSNMLFSLTSGLILTFSSKSIAKFMGVFEKDILIYIGLALIAFAFMLAFAAFAKVLSKKLVQLIIIQDWAWVLASLILLVTRPFGISFEGNILKGLVAGIVGCLALIQKKALG